MIRFFNAVTAISTTAIAIGFGLMSQENERVQNKAALEALYSSQTAAALHFCSNHGRIIAAETIEDLKQLESESGVLTGWFGRDGDGAVPTAVEPALGEGEAVWDAQVTSYEPGSIQSRWDQRLVDFETDFEQKCDKSERAEDAVDEALFAEAPPEAPRLGENSNSSGAVRGIGEPADPDDGMDEAPAPTPNVPDRSAEAPAQQAAQSSRDAYVDAVKQSDNVDLRISQRTEAITAKKSGNMGEQPRRYHAVLASYDVDADEKVVLDRVDLLRRQIEKSGARQLSARVYRTQISNHYAVVVEQEGQSSSKIASSLVERAKTQGWAYDAFMQAENTWTACGTPETVAAVRACGTGR
ncbi:MAG: hypothetical protein AAF253_00695 [Pseudomonadota bacterium]